MEGASVEELQAELGRRDSECAGLKKQVQEGKYMLTALRAQVQLAEARANHAHVALETHAGEVAEGQTLQEHLAKKTQECLDLQVKLKGMDALRGQLVEKELECRRLQGASLEASEREGELEAECRQLRNTAAQATEQAASLHVQLQKVGEQLASREEECKKLQDFTLIRKDEVSAIRANLNAREEELRKLQLFSAAQPSVEVVRELEKMLEDTKASSTSQAEAAEQQRLESLALLEERGRELSVLQEEHKKVRELVDEHAAAFEHATDSLIETQTLLRTQTAELEQTRAEHDAVKARLDNLGVTHAELTQAHCEVKSALAEHRTNVERLRIEHAEAHGRLAEQGAECESLRGSLERSAADVSSMTQRLQECQLERDLFQREAAASGGEVSALSDLLEKLRASNGELRAQVGEQTSEIARLKEALIGLEAELAGASGTAHEEAFDNLEAKLSSSRAAHQSLQLELDTAQADLHKTLLEAQDLREQLHAAQSESSTGRDLSAQTSEFNISDSEDTRSRHSDKVQEAAQARSALEFELEATRVEAQDLRKQLDAALSDSSSLRVAEESLQKELAVVRTELESSHRDLVAVRAELESSLPGLVRARMDSDTSNSTTGWEDTSASEQLLQLENEKRRVTLAIQQCQDELRIDSERRDSLTTELDSMRSELMLLMSTHDHISRELVESKACSVEEELVNARAEIDTLRAKLSSYQCKSHLESTHSDMQIADCYDQVIEDETELKRVQAEFIQASAQIEVLRAKEHQHDEELRRVQLDFKAYRERAAKERSKCQESDVVRLSELVAKKDFELQSHVSSLREEQRRCAELQRSLDAKSAQAETTRKLAGSPPKEPSQLELRTTCPDIDGHSRKVPGPESASVAALSLLGDAELGRPHGLPAVGLSVTESSCSEAPMLQALDRGLQHLSVLMAWRSDLRLAIFGFWMLCHLIYMVNLVYSHWA